MPTLADIYSAIDSAKRRGSDFVRNPGASLQQMLGYANDRARNLNEQTAAAAQEGASYGPASQALAMALAEGYNPTGMIRPISSNTWYRGQTGEKSALPPFQSTLRETPSFADSPEVASAYAMNPNTAGNYGLRAASNVEGASVHPYQATGKVWDLNEYQGGFGTETGIPIKNLIKLAKEVNVKPAELLEELSDQFSQKYGRGKNAYWDLPERSLKSSNKIIPAWVVAENSRLIEAARKKGIDAIQFKGTLSNPNVYEAQLPWNESVLHQELRPLNARAIRSTFETNQQPIK